MRPGELPGVLHPLQDDLAGIVLGTLDPARAAPVEAHLRWCTACAQRLAAEARFESALIDHWPQLQRPPANVVALFPHSDVADLSAKQRVRPAMRAAGELRRLATAAAALALFAMTWIAGTGTGDSMRGSASRPAGKSAGMSAGMSAPEQGEQADSDIAALAGGGSARDCSSAGPGWIDASWGYCPDGRLESLAGLSVQMELSGRGFSAWERCEAPGSRGCGMQ